MAVEFNLEAGMPTVDTAVRRLTAIIYRERSIGTKSFKIIHGYGSTGKGGRLRTELRRYLDKAALSGLIDFYITGENFSIFNDQTRRLLQRDRSYSHDRDIEKYNNGITIIVLK